MFELFNVVNLVGFVVFALVGLLNTVFNMSRGKPDYDFAEKAFFAFTVLLYIEALVSCIVFFTH